MRLLLAEDDDTIAQAMEVALAAAGFAVTTESEGQAVLMTGTAPEFAAIVLDLGLPGLDGMAILKQWRQAGLRTPVLILTARGSWIERVEGMEAGADDYLPKPFHMPELVARLRALVRRTSSLPYPTDSAGDIVVDIRQKRVAVRGRVIDFTPHEFKAITCLVSRRGQVVSTAELMRSVNGQSDTVTLNAMEALIGRIRRKMGPDLIETRRGFGYIIPNERI
jgi:two-component system, OmpR family, response regulator